MSYKTRVILRAWAIGLATGAGMVLAYQAGDWQRRVTETWKKWR